MPKLKIKQIGKEVEIYLDDEPVRLNYLLGADLKMNAGKVNTLTLKYRVRDVEVETDDVEVEEIEVEE